MTDCTQIHQHYFGRCLDCSAPAPAVGTGSRFHWHELVSPTGTTLICPTCATSRGLPSTAAPFLQACRQPPPLGPITSQLQFSGIEEDNRS